MHDPDGNWYLRSELMGTKKAGNEYQVGVPLYGSATIVLAAFNRGGFGSLGDRRSGDGASQYEDMQYFWGRVLGGYGSYHPNDSATNSTYKLSGRNFQTGVDAQLMNNNRGEVFGSVWLDYLGSQIKTYSDVGNGKVNVNGYGIGAALTWYGDKGWYLDSQGKVTRYRLDMKSDQYSNAVASGVRSLGYALSVGGGRELVLNDRWSVTPQAQLIWSSLSTDDYHDIFSAVIKSPGIQDLTARLGVAANYGVSKLHLNGKTTRLDIGGVTNIYQELKSSAGYITVSDVPVAKGAMDKAWGEIGATVNYVWAGGAYSVYGKVSIASSLQHFGDSYSASGKAGIRVKW